MENPKTEVLQTIKDAQNVLVTVSQNPTIDQLSAAIGMTLVLNKLGKHGTAVFSGSSPSTIEFLKPEETLEKNTDSLRDFIISLDKSKADKLRYKVEDQHVKIFITPYKTTIGQEDLIFSHGDFNVDVVLALGVHDQGQLDQAITAHGRILHDAKIVSINVDKPGELGGTNLNEQGTSSLSEVVAQMSLTLKNDVFDSQIATAFLTGIVAETERFSNEKTKPETMNISAKLMAAGANQQLVATQLQVKPEPEPVASMKEAEEPTETGVVESEDSVKHNDGSLEIKHEVPVQPQESHAPQEDDTHAIHVDDDGNFKSSHLDELPKIHKKARPKLEEPLSGDSEEGHARMILEPPSNSGTLTASANDEDNEFANPLNPTEEKGRILSHDDSAQKENDNEETKQVAEDGNQELEIEVPAPEFIDNDNSSIPRQTEGSTSEDNVDQTLDYLEKSVDSPHQQDALSSEGLPPVSNEAAPNVPDLDELQNNVDQALAISGNQPPLEPIAALNANPIDLNLSHAEQATPNLQEVTSSDDDDDYLDVTKLDIESGLQNNDAVTGQEPSKPKFPPDPIPSASTDAVSPASPPPPVPPPMPLYPKDDDGHQTLPPVPPL